MLHEHATLQATAAAVIDAGAEQELVAALPRLVVDAQRPAGAEGLQAEIAPWFATYPQPERSDPEWDAFWQAYVLVCGNCSVEAIRAAMLAWAKRPDAQFLPKPGQLFELAKASPTPQFKLVSRVQQVLAAVDQIKLTRRVAQDMAQRRVTAEAQADQIRGMLAVFRRDTRETVERARRVLTFGHAYADAAPQFAPCGGTPPKGHAITREMMRLLGRPEPAVAEDAAVSGHLDAPLEERADFSDTVL